MALTLRNPHSVLAVLRTRPQDIFHIRPPAQANDVWKTVLREASDVGVACRTDEDAGRRQRGGRGNQGGREGGGEARIREKAEASLDDVLAEGRGLRLALEQVQDPRNLGSIFRSAAFFGVGGLVLTRDRSARVSDAAYDTASGGIEYVDYAVETNLRRVLEEAKQKGFWILGTSEHASTDLGSVPMDRQWLVVCGNEENGLRRLTLETCDEVCRIRPASGGVESLNVAVAAALIIQRFAGTA